VIQASIYTTVMSYPLTESLDATTMDIHFLAAQDVEIPGHLKAAITFNFGG
jgi:hypothetical protein